MIKTFLVALAQSYDPHSEYMSPSDMENFNIQMRLSLVGIGAVLRTDDGYAKIVEVVPGGLRTRMVASSQMTGSPPWRRGRGRSRMSST